MTLSVTERLTLAKRSLDGLSVGDAFGDTFFLRPADPTAIRERIEAQILPDAPWYYTDDTQMALSIVAVLQAYGTIDQDRLATHFAHHYDARRKYGASIRGLLLAIRDGEAWAECARNQFEGQGSYGNGAAMRVAPLGAFFADDLEEVVRQATLSAQVTHAHPEAIAGAIAIAVATALTWQLSQSGNRPTRSDFIAMILPFIPESRVFFETRRARDISERTSVEAVAAMLGSGYSISAQDTVPFVLWCAGEYLHNFEEALWQTVRGLGDMDTTCAMVGGIVALSSFGPGIPDTWLQAREALPIWEA